MKRYKIIITGTRWATVLAGELKQNNYDVTLVETFNDLGECLVDMVILTSDRPELDSTKYGDGSIENQVTILRDRYPNLKIIVMDCYDDSKIADEYRKLGADEYIAIPFESGEAIKKIEKVFRRDQKILLVAGDDLGNEFGTKLRQEGYQVSLLESHNKFGQILQMVDEKYLSMIILTNNTLTPSGILELIPMIKQKQIDLPIMVISGYDPDDFKHQLKQFGIVEFLNLPCEINDFIVSVNKYI